MIKKAFSIPELVILVVAALLGIAIAWFDSRPGWDDTAITAGVLLMVAALFGALRPRRAWLWALALGGWIPLYGIFTGQGLGILVVLAIPFIGAYAGALVRRAWQSGEG